MAIPIITAFYSPAHPDYRFADFYLRLKGQGFVIYPGKVSQADCFRIGNIGDVTPARVRDLLAAMASACYWQGDAMTSMLAQGRDLRGRDLHDHKLHGSGRADSEGISTSARGGALVGRPERRCTGRIGGR